MKNKVIQSLRGQLLCYGSWGERLISQEIWWWVRQVERLAITREQGQSKRVRHSLGSEIRRVRGDGEQEKASQVGELLPTGTQRLQRALLHVHKNAMKTNEKENRPNRTNLGRDSRGKSKTGGTQGSGEELSSSS